MTRNEFMEKLTEELRRRRVGDAAEVAEEYEQHFAFKLADGYSEEEIAARLGDPAALAAQFEPQSKPPRRSAGLTRLWLSIVDLFFGILSVFLGAFGVVLGACVVAFGTTGICLIGGLERLPMVSLPSMPLWCGIILGLSLLGLAALSAVGCVWFFAFLRQTLRAYGRFHQNALAPCRGEAILPGLPLTPQLSGKTKRRLRTAALAGLVLFAVCFVGGYLACSLAAGSPEFWHVWGWFAG